MKSYLFIGMLLASGIMSGQEKIAKLARPGGKGIFVFCSDKIPKETSTLTGFRIERKSGNDTEFRKVAELKTVPSLKEFKKNFYASAEMFPYPAELDLFKLDTLWNISNRNPTIKALGIAGSSIPVLAGFQMIWLDTDVKPGISYEYRVIGTGEPILESPPVTFGKTIPGNGLIFKKAAYDQTNGKMHIDLYSVDKNKPVYIQSWRSENKQSFKAAPSAFSFVPRVDTVEYRVTDSTATAYQVYHYAFKSWDVYGNEYPPSDTVFITALDYLQMPLPNKIKAKGDTTGKAIKITWEQPAAGAIKMMTLYRSRNSVNNFEPVAILSADQREFLDEQVEPATSYFYYFEIIFKTSDAPKRTASFASSFHDKSLPAIPQYVEAVNKDKGILVSWQYSGSATKGFNLYRSADGRRNNGPRKEAGRKSDREDAAESKKNPNTLLAFIPLAGKAEYSFFDNDSTMHGDRFYNYFLTAVSTSHIEGLPSDTATARPLYNIPVPPAPFDIKAVATGDNIFVVWDNVNEIDRQVSGYLLLRTNESSNKTDTIPTGVNHFTDSTAKSGNRYSYRVISYSDFGVRSAPSGKATIELQSKLPDAPTAIRTAKEKTGIKLNWDLPENGNLYSYEIFRYQRGTQPKKAGAAGKGESTFIDKTVVRGEQYFYFIKSVNPDNLRSTNSNESGISY